MKNTKRDIAGEGTNSSELLELIPSADWKDPGKPHTITDIYGNQVEVRPGSQVDGRPLSHRKQYVGGTMATNGGNAYPVERGERVRGAQRGVGQDSLDGFMEKNPKSVWASLPDETKMQVLASYIKGNIMKQALGAAAKTVGALGIPTR